MAKKASIFETNTLKKGAWSEEEDEKLRAYIQRYGHWNWSLLPKFAGLSRSGKSCRLRWMNYLRPNMKHGNFTKEEDDNIVNLHKKLGNKWSAIAANLPGRSDNEIKNRWNIHLKRRAKEDHNVYENNHDENNHDENIKFDQAPSCSSGSEPSSWGFSDLDYAMSSDSMLKISDYEHTDDFWMEPFMTDITSPVDNTLSWSLVDDFISQFS